jgi:hypothetical protein
VFINEISGKSTAAADVIAAAMIAITCEKRRRRPTTNVLFAGFGPFGTATAIVGAEQRAVPERQITECDPTFIPTRD